MANILVFDNASYVDTANFLYASESDNTQATLSNLGHAVGTTTATDAAGLAAALVGQHALVIPEMEVGTWIPTADVIAVIQSFVAGGGTLVIHGFGGNQASFLNTVFGFSVASTNVSGPFAKSLTAPSEFDSEAASLPWNDGTEGLSIASLPGGSNVFYGDGANAAMADLPYGGGSVLYVGWDWFGSSHAPGGFLDNGWHSAYGAALDATVETNSPPDAVDDDLSPATTGVLDIGYYDMSAGQGVAAQIEAIVAAGHNAVLITELSAATLAGIDMLVVQNPSNGDYAAEYLAALADIEAAVNGGLKLIIHDRFVENAESILPGSAGFNIVRNFTEDAAVDFINDAHSVASGPGGILNDASLDGGTSSNHGFAIAGTLPSDADLILSTNDGNHIVTFSYGVGAGHVVYSSIPIDFYLADTVGAGGNDMFGQAEEYLTNLIDYTAVDLGGALTDEDTAVVIDGADLLANDTDPDGDPLAISAVSATSTLGGTVTLNGDGTIDYDPSGALNYLAEGEVVEDSFTYTIDDGNGGTDTATVEFKVLGVNDGPTANDDVLGAVNSVQLATNGGFETGTTGWVMTNAGDGGWSVESDTLPPSGAFTTPGPHSGTFYVVSYQGGPGVHALEQSFTIPTGTMSLSLSYALFAQTTAGEFINIAGLDHNASPNQHARVDLLIDGSAALSTSVSDIVRNFYLGIDGAPTQPWTVYSFDITADVTAGGTFDLRFAQVDNQTFFNLGVDSVSLTAEVLSSLTDEDTAIVIDGADLLANDTDPDTSDTLTISGVSATSSLGAAVVLNGDGTIGYDPTTALNYLAEGEVVEDTFTYTISDGNGGTDTATVTFNVVGINDAPSAPVDIDPTGDTLTADATISEHLAVGSNIGIEADSTDPEGDPVTYYFRDGANAIVQTLGKFTIDANTGVVTLAAEVNFELETSYTITIYASDGTLESSATFDVDITNVVEHLFTPNNDGTEAAPIDFNALPPGAYDLDGAQYDALSGDDYVYLPNLATSALPGHVWDYSQTFNASAGNDVVQGGDGNDIVSGGEGNDRLFGGDGDDRLVGSAGNDILGGGDGSDKMTGSSGRDIFILTDSEIGTTKAGEHDVITDFQQGTDKIDISALYDNGVVYGGLKNGALNGTVGNAYKAGFYSASGKTWLEGDVTGDGTADWVVEMSGSYKLKGSDIVAGQSIIESLAQWNAATGSLPYVRHHQDDYFIV